MRLRISIILCSVLALLSGIQTEAQLCYELLPYRDGDKWGYCNRNGKVIIKPQWDGANTFGHFSAKVKTGNGLTAYYCLIDEKGEYIIPPELHWNGYWQTTSSGTTMNINDSNGHIGRVDTNGHIIIPMIYDEIGSIHTIFSRDFYRVFQNGKMGLIRKDGSEVLPCKYKEIWHNSPVDLNPPAFLVSPETVYDPPMLLDSNENVLLQLPTRYTPSFRHTGTANTVYYAMPDSFFIWEHYPKGKPKQIPYRLEWLYMDGGQPFTTIYSIRGDNGKLGFADAKGNVLVAPQYDEVYVDTGMTLLVENKLKTGNNEEQYEYMYLDTSTLKPVSEPIRSAESGIELAKHRDKQSYDDGEEEQYNRWEDEMDSDEEQEITYEVTHKKGPYLLHVHNQQESYSPQERFIAVTVMDSNKNVLGHTLADQELDLKLPLQPYRFFDIEDLNEYMHTIILTHENKYALADTNLNILINFEDWYPIPNTYFNTDGKHYAIATMGSEETIHSLGKHTYVQLIGGDGKTVHGFEQQYHVSIMNNENLWGRTIRHLAVRDSNDLTGIVNLKAETLYPEISYQYSRITELSPNLFKTTDKDGKNIKLVNSKNKDLFPDADIRRIEFAVPYYFATPIDKPIPGIFIVHLNNDVFFYINEKGKPFAKNINITSRTKQ